jgi:lysyl-tRNA synthetase class 2
MLEWYRSGAGLDAMLDDLESLICDCATIAPALDADGRLQLPTGGSLDVLTRPWPRIPVGDLVRQATGIDLAGCSELEDLVARMHEAGRGEGLETDDAYEQVFSRLWAESEHLLPKDRPCFVTEWPAPVASLARLEDERPWLAERAELVIAGVELSNGFCELTDAQEQARRFTLEINLRSRRGMPEAAADTVFLASLEAGMPPSSGMALGFDRLTMLLAGADSIRDVLTFTADEL